MKIVFNTREVVPGETFLERDALRRERSTLTLIQYLDNGQALVKDPVIGDYLVIWQDKIATLVTVDFNTGSIMNPPDNFSKLTRAIMEVENESTTGNG